MAGDGDRLHGDRDRLRDSTHRGVTDTGAIGYLSHCLLLSVDELVSDSVSSLSISG